MQKLSYITRYQDVDSESQGQSHHDNQQPQTLDEHDQVYIVSHKNSSEALGNIQKVTFNQPPNKQVHANEALEELIELYLKTKVRRRSMIDRL